MSNLTWQTVRIWHNGIIVEKQTIKDRFFGMYGLWREFLVVYDENRNQWVTVYRVDSILQSLLLGSQDVESAVKNQVQKSLNS